MLTEMCCTWAQGGQDRDIQHWADLVEMKITRHMLSTLKVLVHIVPLLTLTV